MKLFFLKSLQQCLSGIHLNWREELSWAEESRRGSWVLSGGGGCLLLVLFIVVFILQTCHGCNNKCKLEQFWRDWTVAASLDLLQSNQNGLLLYRAVSVIGPRQYCDHCEMDIVSADVITVIYRCCVCSCKYHCTASSKQHGLVLKQRLITPTTDCFLLTLHWLPQTQANGIRCQFL